MDTQKLNRRAFLKGSAIGLGAVTMGNMLLARASNKKEDNIRNFSLSFAYNSRFQTHNTINLWLPLALSNGFQTPYNLMVEGNYDSYSLNNHDNTPILYAVWQNNNSEKHLKMSLDVKTKFVKSNLNFADFANTQTQDRYIRSNHMIQSIVRAVNNGIQSDIQKAEKLFAWVTNNISSQEGADMQGIRSIKDIHGNEILRGENLSSSSVFVALCREAGLSSLECFGVSLDSGRYDLNSLKPTIYTRSAIAINGAWIVNDSLLAIKAREASQSMNTKAQDYPAIIKSSFNQWDNNWIMLNHTRDIRLNSILVSTLQQAYGEIDGVKLSSYDFNHFSGNIAV